MGMTFPWFLPLPFFFHCVLRSEIRRRQSWMCRMGRFYYSYNNMVIKICVHGNLFATHIISQAYRRNEEGMDFRFSFLLVRDGVSISNSH